MVQNIDLVTSVMFKYGFSQVNVAHNLAPIHDPLLIILFLLQAKDLQVAFWFHKGDDDKWFYLVFPLSGYHIIISLSQ